MLGDGSVVARKERLARKGHMRELSRVMEGTVSWKDILASVGSSQKFNSSDLCVSLNINYANFRKIKHKHKTQCRESWVGHGEWGKKTDQDRHQCQWDEYVQTAQVKKGHEVRRKKKDHDKRKFIFQGRRMGVKVWIEWCVENPQRISWKNLIIGIKELWGFYLIQEICSAHAIPCLFTLVTTIALNLPCGQQPHSSVVTSHGRVHPCGAMVKVVLGKS